MAPTSMEVVAVSHSVPQWIDMRGKRVYTSIIHTPLTSPHESIELIPAQGIAGNASAAHNAQVYIFFSHHYDYWSERLHVPRESWGWCHWGENLTLRCSDTVTEADFHLGDVWKMGGQVRLQVCGSRVPCFKLAWRCGQADSWLGDLASTGKCGVYLKVLQGGLVRPGDVAELESKASSGPMVDCATITRVAFADALSTRSTMDLLVDHPDLLDMNKLVFRRKLSMLHDQSLVGKGAWKGWRRVCVSRVVEETPDIKSFYITATEGCAGPSLAAYLPGQFTTVRLPDGLVRCWSISTYPDTDKREMPETYRISIRKAGVASSWMHDNCLPGTMLDIQTPNGGFVLDWSPQFPGRQVYMSAGIGITPMIAMFRAHLQHQAMQRAPGIWVHISRDTVSLPFREELKVMLQTPEARELKICVFLFLSASGPDECAALEREMVGDRPPGDVSVSVLPGRPTIELLRPIFSNPYLMDPLKITPIEIEGKFSTVYLCGPTAFEENMKSTLAEFGVPDPMVLYESFSGEPQASGASAVSSAQITFKKAKKTISWTRKPRRNSHTSETDTGGGSALDPPPTLLELAEEVGLAPDFGCRTGVCGACEQTLCGGKVTAGLQPGGAVRICVARPAAELVEVDL